MAERAVSEHRITVDGRDRAYLTVVGPARAVDAIVLVLHGSNQNGRSFRRFSRGTFDALADRGAIVAYPDGYRGSWNDARISTNTAARRDGVDDVAFVDAMHRALVPSTQQADPPVFVAGFSAGGSMVVRLLHERPELFAGAGIIAAAQPTPGNFAAEIRAGAVPLALFHGTADRFVPYRGGVASLRGFFPRGEVMSAAETAEYFAHRNGARGDPVTTRVADGVTRTEYPGAVPTVLHTFEDAGHAVPGGRSSWFMGRASHALVAAEALGDLWGLPSAQ